MIQFVPKAFDEEADIDAMDPEELKDYMAQLQEQIAELDKKEPRNMNSEAYEAWGDRHELLEDLLDDVLDRLDEMA